MVWCGGILMGDYKNTKDTNGTDVIEFCCFLPPPTEKCEEFCGGETTVRIIPQKTVPKPIPKKCACVENFVNFIPEDESFGTYLSSFSSTPSTNSPPQSKSDLNLLNDVVKNYFQSQKDGLEGMKKQLNRLKWIQENSPNKLERKIAAKGSFTLKRDIKRIENDNDRKEYEKLSRHIFEEYNQLIREPDIQDFIYTTTAPSEERRTILLQQFISVCNRFLPNHQKFENEILSPHKSCTECGNTNFDTQTEQIQVCLECGVCIETVEQNNISYRDTTRINLAPRFNYTRRGHFKEAMDKFEGKQNTTIPDKVFTIIEDEMKKNDIAPDKLTKDHIFTFLQQYNYGDYYEDTNLIHFRITGIPPPNISQHRIRLLELNDEVEQIYDEVKEEGRVNALNVYYKLSKLHEFLGYECKMEDFNFLKTRTKIIEHDEVMGKIFNRKGWDFIPTI